MDGSNPDNQPPRLPAGDLPRLRRPPATAVPLNLPSFPGSPSGSNEFPWDLSSSLRLGRPGYGKGALVKRLHHREAM